MLGVQIRGCCTARRSRLKSKWSAPAAILLVVTALAACALPAAPMPAGEPAFSPKETVMPTQEQFSPLSTPGAPRSPHPAGVAGSAARRDLAQRLKIAEDQIEIVSVQKMEMPIGSLGCGETEGRQNQGLIVGEEIVLQAQGQEYTYHFDGSRLVPCSPAAFPGGARPLYVTGGESPRGPAPQALAIADLAQRLGLPESAITVRTVESVEWPDASLGCPRPGMMYAQVITPGYRIVLEAAGQTYEYHTSQSHVVLCSGIR